MRAGSIHAKSKVSEKKIHEVKGGGGRHLTRNRTVFVLGDAGYYIHREKMGLDKKALITMIIGKKGGVKRALMSMYRENKGLVKNVVNYYRYVYRDKSGLGKGLITMYLNKLNKWPPHVLIS